MYEFFVLFGSVMCLIGGFLFTLSSFCEYRERKSVSLHRIIFAVLGYTVSGVYFFWWVRVFS